MRKTPGKPHGGVRRSPVGKSVDGDELVGADAGCWCYVEVAGREQPAVLRALSPGGEEVTPEEAKPGGFSAAGLATIQASKCI